MPLELILGRAKTGKSTAVLEAFLKQENAILVVPEQYSFSMEKKITERLGVFGLDGRQVMSFKRLAAKAAGKFLPFGQNPLSKDARCMAIYAIMKELAGELRVLENAQEKPGFTKTMVEMISELKRYQVTQEQLLALSEKLESPLLSMKLSDIAKIYGCFNEFLGKDFFDGDDALTLFEKIIAETGYLKDTWVFFDQFSSFTPQECACIGQMLSGAKGVTVSLCLDPKSQGPEFLATRRTYERLCKMAGGAQNVKVKSLSKSHGLCPALKHLEQNYFAYPFVPFAQKTDDVVLYQGQDPREELEFVASQICTLTRDFGYYYRDIALLFADAQSYNDLAADVFQKYEIPYFSDRLSAVSDHPVVQFVLSAVDMASSGFTYESVFGYLKSGYANLSADEVDRLENYVLATGLPPSAWAKDEKWDYYMGVFLSKQDEAAQQELSAQMDEARRRFLKPVLALKEKIKGRTPLAQKARALYEFMCEMELPAAVTAQMEEQKAQLRPDEAARCARVFNCFVDVLDNLAGALGDKKMGPGQFGEILRLGLAEYEVGVVPTGVDHVMAGDAGRTNAIDAKVLFLIGANYGAFPKSISFGGLLSDGDREKMEQEGVALAPGGKQQAFLQQHMVYTCLSMPTEKLFISYATSDAEGASLRPSGVVARVSRIFGNMAPKSALTEKKIESVSVAAAAFSHLVDAMASGPLCGVDQMVYGWFKNSDAWREKLLVLERLRRRENRAVPLRKEQMELLFPKDIKTSVSRLEQYNACPFSYFMNYMLKAAPRQKSGVALPDGGTYLHRMMDGFCRALAGDGLTWRQATDEYIARTTEALAQELYGGMNRYLLESSPRTAFLFSKLNAISQNAIRCVRDHISQSKFEPLGYEIQFDENGRFKPLTVTLPTGQAVSLSGRIDRADVLKGETETFLRVVDYKSGDKSFDLGEVYHGLNLQLAVYLTALCGQTGARPAGILYFKLDDPVAALEQAASDAEIEKELLKKLRMKGLILSEEPVVDAMESFSGAAKFLPVKKTKSGLSGSVASGAQFALLQKQVKKTVAQISGRLRAGDVSISPYKLGEKTPCQWCPYHSCCAFEPGAGCRWRVLPQFADDKIWELMKEEG